MKRLFKIVLSLVVLSVFITGCFSKSTLDNNSVESIKKRGKIVMYTESGFPPFEYLKGGEIVGFDVDIAKAIADDLGVALEIKDANFETLLGALEAGKADFVAAGLSKTEEREKKVDFTVNYNSSIQALITKNSAVINKFEDFKGKKVGVQTGSTSSSVAETALKDYIADKSVEIKYYKSPLDASQDILSGKLDVVILDQIAADAISSENAGLTFSIFKDQNGKEFVEYTSIALKKGNTSLLNQINSTLQRLINEKKIEELMKNHYVNFNKDK